MCRKHASINETAILFQVVVSAGVRPGLPGYYKSDLRNHCAIVQPRLKTEGPHGLPSDRSPRRLPVIRQRRRSGYAWPGLVFILTDYDAVNETVTVILLQVVVSGSDLGC